MKKLKLLSIFLLILALSLPAYSGTNYRVSCQFSDGTGWVIHTTSEYWFGYYSGVCATQQINE